MQGIIADCKSMPLYLQSSQLFRKVVRTGSNTEEALSEYLSRWYAAWAETVEVTRSGLNATLLVQHPVTLKLCVNFDQGIKQLIRDAKGFQRAGFPLPIGAKRVLEDEGKLTFYHSALKEAVDRFHECVNSIAFPLRSLFSIMIEKLEAKLEPGKSTLTWKSVNIDAFLVSVEAGISEMQDVAAKANKMLRSKIELVLKRIKSTSLMDISNEKTYTLGDGGIETFVTEQEKIISQRASKISAEIRGAEEALEALVSLVPTPYPFHTDDNHYENDLKVSFVKTPPLLRVHCTDLQTIIQIKFGFLAYQATRGCVIHTLNILKERLASGPTGLFYIVRPIFDVDIELQVNCRING